MSLTAHPYLSSIENYIPGKSTIGDKKPIKLSSNENALGASPKAIEAYLDFAKEISRYADGSSTNLREKIALKNNLDPKKIVCGAGSDEIIALLTSAFAGIDDEIIYSEHGFLMYPISAKRVGAKAIKVPEKNLKTDIDAIINHLTPKTKIIFIANPNNPTGSYLTGDEIKKLVSNIPSDVLLVLDHAYEEFVEKNDYYDAFEIVNKNHNVVVTRTFSKIYGLASLRIGWCYSSQYIADILNKIRGPFNVSGAAQIAAIKALEDDEFFYQSKKHNQKWLEIFYQQLQEVNKIKLYPSVANFILIDFFSEKNCQKINQQLLAESIILREMSGYGLPSCLRMTIGNESENQIVIATLKKLCDEL